MKLRQIGTVSISNRLEAVKAIGWADPCVGSKPKAKTQTSGQYIHPNLSDFYLWGTQYGRG